MTESTEVKELTFRGYKLQRQGKDLFYGNLGSKYVTLLQITGSEKVKDMDISRTVIVKLLNTDPNLEVRKRLEKKAEKDSLYAAVDLAATWLDRYLKPQ